MYVSEIVGPNSIGRPLGRWMERIKEYMCERSATRMVMFEQARWEVLTVTNTMLLCGVSDKLKVKYLSLVSYL